MLGISTVFVFTVIPVYLSLGLFNPTPQPFCSVSSYPNSCITMDEVDCIRGDVSKSTTLMLNRVFFIPMVGFAFLCVFSSMIIVVTTIFKMELSHKRSSRTRMRSEEDGNGDDEGRERNDVEISSRCSNANSNASANANANIDDFEHSRTALRQALMYIAAFILTWIWIVITVVDERSEVKEMIEPLFLLFQPLQGMFNAAIFFSSKVTILRKSNTSLTQCEALRRVILSPSSVPEVLVSCNSDLDLEVSMDSEMNDQRMRIMGAGSEVSPITECVLSTNGNGGGLSSEEEVTTRVCTTTEGADEYSDENVQADKNDADDGNYPQDKDISYRRSVDTSSNNAPSSIIGGNSGMSGAPSVSDHSRSTVRMRGRGPMTTYAQGRSNGDESLISYPSAGTSLNRSFMSVSGDGVSHGGEGSEAKSTRSTVFFDLFSNRMA